MDEYTIIGKGMSGIVYYPALPCKEPSDFDSTGFVSKLTTQANAETELNNAAEIKRTIPTHAIYAIHICASQFTTINRSKQVLDTLVFSKYGGVEIVQYAKELEEYAYSATLTADKLQTVSDKLPIYKKITHALQELLVHVKKMNNLSFFHNDISTDNIVYSFETDTAYLIDFEKSGPAHIKSTTRHIPPMPTDVEILERIIKSFIFEIEAIESKLQTTSKGGQKYKRRRRTHFSNTKSRPRSKTTRKHKRPTRRTRKNARKNKINRARRNKSRKRHGNSVRINRRK